MRKRRSDLEQDFAPNTQHLDLKSSKELCNIEDDLGYVALLLGRVLVLRGLAWSFLRFHVIIANCTVLQNALVVR